MMKTTILGGLLCAVLGTVVGLEAKDIVISGRIPATAPATQPATIVISGTAVFREKIMLPMDTVMVVTVTEAIKSDPPKQLVTKTFPTGGINSAAFAVEVTASDVDQNKKYVLSVVMKDGEKVVFRNANEIPVLTGSTQNEKLNIVLVAAHE